MTLAHRTAAVADDPPWWVAIAASVVRRLPFGRFRAAALIAQSGVAPFVARMPREIGGARFWCDLRDVIARDVCLAGAYEPQVTRTVLQVLARGMTVVDAGANWGYFTLLAASAVGPAGRVLALEPDPRMFDLLQRNLMLNAFAHASAIPVAASRSAGRLTLQGYAAGAANRGTSRIHDAGGGAATSFDVGAVRLDDALEAQGMGAIDLVKIDVEGAEDAVLDGMRDGLRDGRYRRILLELHPELLAARGLTADGCCAPLARAGYQGWTFDHSAASVRRAAYAPSLDVTALLTRADRVPPDDPWPHMLWTRPDSPPF